MTPLAGPIRPALLVLWAAMIALFAAWAAALMNARYYAGHPFLGDTASFFSFQFDLWNRAEVEPLASVLWGKFLSEWKNPGLYLSYVIQPRDQLASVNGHVPYTAFAIFCFVGTFSAAVLKRTGSWAYAAVSPLVLFALVGLFDPVYQIPSKLADPPAVFFFGAAICAIFASDWARRPIWLAVAGGMIGLTLLSRFIAGGYIFVSAAPVLAAFFSARIVSGEWRRAVAGGACLALPIIVLDGYHLATFVQPVLAFYREAGYGLNKGIAAALQTTGAKFLSMYLQSWGVVVPLLLAGAYAALFWSRRRGLGETVLTLWTVVAHPVLILLVLTVEDDAPQLTYMIGGYLLFMVAPFRIGDSRPSDGVSVSIARWGAALTPAMMAMTLLVPLVAAPKAYVDPMTVRDERFASFNLALADIVGEYWSRLGRSIQLDADFDYYWRYIQPTAAARSGAIVLPARRFDIRQEQWAIRNGVGPRDPAYPETAIAEMMGYYNGSADLLVVLADTDRPEAVDGLKDPFTTDMAKRLRAALQADPNWQVAASGIAGPYGEAEVWRNVSRTQ